MNGQRMADNFSVVLNGLKIHSDIPLTWYIVDIAVNTVFSVVAIIGNTFIIVNESDPRSNVHYLGSSENKA